MQFPIAIQEFEPRQELSPFVTRLVDFEYVATDVFTHKLAPSGRIIMTHNFGEYCYKTTPNEVVHFGKETRIHGHPIDPNARVTYSTGSKHVVCEFTYTGFHQLFHISAEPFINLEKPIRELGFPELDKELLSTDDMAVKRKIIEDFLMKLVPDALEPDPEIDNIISAVERDPSSTFKALDDFTDTEKKRLYRKFKKHVGLSPKQYHRIFQMNLVIRLIREGNFSNLTELGNKAGYYDQASFIRHLKQYLSESPKWLLGNPQELIFQYMGGPVDL